MYLLYFTIAFLLILLFAVIYYKKYLHPNEGFMDFQNSINNNNNNNNGIRTYAGLTNHSDAPWTIDKPTKLIITDILRKILNMINTKTGMSYVFTAYDQLAQKVVDKSRTRFTADFFVHEMRNLFTRRILVIFVVNFATKAVDVEYVNLSNAFKNPSKSFMDYPTSDLILQDDNLRNNEYHIMGLNKSTIDFSILKTTLPKQVPTPTEFQQWILPMGIASAYQNPQAIFPSRRQSTCWNSSGVNYAQPQTKLQMGISNSPLTKYPYPYFNPTVNRQREWDTNYKWQFDLADSAGMGAGRGVAGSP